MGVLTGRTSTAQRRAFTTVEILIVMVIIGIVAAISMPSIATNVARDRVRRAQFIVAADIERAFQYAARVRKPVTIVINSTTKVLTVADRSSGTAYYQRDLSQTGTWALTGVTITPAAGITIFPTGISSAALTIVLTNNAYFRTISATIAGQVTKS